MIELYYWPTPNGWKASILLEELGLPPAVHWVNIAKGDQFAPERPTNVIPAKAGISDRLPCFRARPVAPDPGFRRDDGNKGLAMSEQARETLFGQRQTNVGS